MSKQLGVDEGRVWCRRMEKVSIKRKADDGWMGMNGGDEWGWIVDSGWMMDDR